MNSLALLWLVVGGVCGAALMWGWLRRNAQHAQSLAQAQLEHLTRAKAEAEITAERRRDDLAASYEARLEEMRATEQRLAIQLEALLPKVADSVLAQRAQQLTATAKGELQLLEGKTVAEVKTSNQQLQETVNAMAQQLGQYQARLAQIEVERAQAAERVEQQLLTVAGAGQAMLLEARTIKQALQSSHSVRGQWGESVLRNILESCGLTLGHDYELQTALSESEGRLRPDVTIFLPSGRKLIIDAKASLSQFLEGIGTGGPEDPTRLEAWQKGKFKEFAGVLRRRADELASKDYSGNLEHSVPCVVMFVPSEAAFRAALDADPGLFQYGQERRPRVVLASPSTLFPLIQVIAQGWDQQKMENQAVELAKEVTELAKRMEKFFGYVQKIGRALESANTAFNQASGSYQQRLAPQMRRLCEMGADFTTVQEPTEIQSRPVLALDEADAPKKATGAGA